MLSSEFLSLAFLDLKGCRFCFAGVLACVMRTGLKISLHLFIKKVSSAMPNNYEGRGYCCVLFVVGFVFFFFKFLYS